MSAKGAGAVSANALGTSSADSAGGAGAGVAFATGGGSARAPAPIIVALMLAGFGAPAAAEGVAFGLSTLSTWLVAPLVCACVPFVCGAAAIATIDVTATTSSISHEGLNCRAKRSRSSSVKLPAFACVCSKAMGENEGTTPWVYRQTRDLELGDPSRAGSPHRIHSPETHTACIGTKISSFREDCAMLTGDR